MGDPATGGGGEVKEEKSNKKKHDRDNSNRIHKEALIKLWLVRALVTRAMENTKHTICRGRGERNILCWRLAGQRYSGSGQVNFSASAGVWTDLGMLVEIQLSGVHDLPAAQGMSMSTHLYQYGSDTVRKITEKQLPFWSF